ncbi:hypothetical protein [Prauserella cavernicola]|uniref:Uncharacterized protein n=1 Tax=Prauserella cavernicola TaxID=2800127 RepID=A0A934QR56_9PSEU|nr:hypothetical protein [Prauserella cavernicola]MBK1784712.1 hypothetical protein [Prauserella cavernicola]
MTRFSDCSSFDVWLDERDAFDGGRLAQITRSGDGLITLVLEQCLRLGLLPGDHSTLDVYELVTTGAGELDPPTERGPSDILDPIETAEVDGRIAISIPTWPGSTRLVATDLTVRHVGTEQRRTEPFVSEAFTVVTGTDCNDLFWRTRVGELLGAPVVWRVLGSRTPGLPGLDTDGCFLQRPDLLASTNHGVFCTRGRTGTTTMSRYSREADADLWRAVQWAGAEFERIRSGNCVFERADWENYLATGQFPPDEKLRGSLVRE